MKRESPTQRTLKELRRLGYHAGVVERYCNFTKRRHDFLGCIDVLAFRADSPGVVGIQCTSAANLASRVAKILNLGEPVHDWLLAANRLEVWGWRKRAKPEDRRWWHANRREIALCGGRMEAREL